MEQQWGCVECSKRQVSSPTPSNPSFPCVSVDCVAVPQAVARQQEFEKSAVGKATMKAVKAAKQREEPNRGPDLAQDWRS
jgi:hypothetical protein